MIGTIWPQETGMSGMHMIDATRLGGCLRSVPRPLTVALRMIGTTGGTASRPGDLS